MKSFRSYAALCAGGAILLFAGVEYAQSSVHARTASEGAGAPEIVPHGVNPHDKNDDAATAGSTGVITPVITYHGGPVMSAPNVYLIWYGNWNQANGSDTADGQGILQDFLHGLST